MATYLQRLLRANRRNIIVVSIEATQIIARRKDLADGLTTYTTWTQDPNYNNLFYIDRPITAHGIRREVTNIRVGKHEYRPTPDSDFAYAQQHHRTWIHDRFSGRTWIHPKGRTAGSGGIDLDTMVVGLRFKSWYSNAMVNYPEIDKPLPWIANDSDIATVTRSVTDKYFGAGSFQGGSLKFINGAKEWDDELWQHSYFDGEVQVFHLIEVPGWTPSTWDDKRLLHTEMINGWKCTRPSMEFALKNPAIKGRKAKLHKTTHTTDTSNGDPTEQDAKPNMNENNEGQNEPHLIGQAIGGSTDQDKWERGYPCVIVDKGDSDFKTAEIRVSTRHIDPETDEIHGNGDVSYVMVQHANGVLEPVDGANWNQTAHAQGVSFVGDYTIDPEGDKFRIGLDGVKDSEMSADIPGKYTGSAGSTIKEPLDLWRLYVAKRGTKHSKINIASFTKIGETRPDADGNPIPGTFDPPSYYGGQRYFGHYGGMRKDDYDSNLQMLEKAAGVTVQLNAAGEHQAIQVLNKVDLDAPILKFKYLGSLEFSSSLEDTPSRVIVNCKHNQHTQSFRQKKSDKTVSIGGKDCSQEISHTLWEQDKEDVIDTMIAAGSDGEEKANEEFDRWIWGPIHINTSEILGVCMDRLPGQQVFLQLDRGPGMTNYERGIPCWIISTRVNAFAATCDLQLLRIPDEVQDFDYTASVDPETGTTDIFSDDFEDFDYSTPAWTTSNPSSWDASTGMLVGTTTSKREILSPTFDAITTATFEFNVQINGNGYLYMWCWYVSGSNKVELKFQKNVNKIKLKQTISGTHTSKSASFTIADDTSYNVKITYFAGNFTVKIDDVLKITMAGKGTPAGGLITLGVKSPGGTTVIGRYEDVRVYS